MSPILPSATIPAAVFAGARAEVDDVVGGPHHRLVVLDDDDGVPDVAEVLERADEACVVDGVESDGRLIADVEHAHETGADLGGEPDALSFAAAERARRAGEGEVFEADVAQELEPGVDLLEHLVGDGLLARGEGLGVAVLRPAWSDVRHRSLVLNAAHPGRRLGDREIGDLDDRAVGDGHGQRLGTEPVAVAGVAVERGHVALNLGADVVGAGVAVAAFQVGDDALERRVPLEHAPPVTLVADAHLLAAADAVEDLITGMLGEPLPGDVRGEIVGCGETAEDAVVPVRGSSRTRPRRDGAAVERQVRIGHDEVGVDHETHAESRAPGTRAMGAVEAERARFDLGEADAAVGAGEVLGVDLLGVRVGVDREHAAIAETQRRLDGVDDAATLGLVVEDETVDDDFDGVPLELVEHDLLAEVADLAVDADTDEAGLGGFFEGLLCSPFLWTTRGPAA